MENINIISKKQYVMATKSGGTF